MMIALYTQCWGGRPPSIDLTHPLTDKKHSQSCQWNKPLFIDKPERPGMIILTGMLVFDSAPIEFIWGGKMETVEQLLNYEIVSFQHGGWPRAHDSKTSLWSLLSECHPTHQYIVIVSQSCLLYGMLHCILTLDTGANVTVSMYILTLAGSHYNFKTTSKHGDHPHTRVQFGR